MDRLEAARREIDRIDGELAALFEARMGAAAEIAAWKRAQGLPVLDKAREGQVLARNTARIENPALRPRYAAVLEAMMAQSRAWQRELGAEGSPEAPALWVRAPGGEYPVYLASGVLERAASLLNPDRKLLIVTDEGVPAAYAETLAAQCSQSRICRVPQGESSKSPRTLEELWNTMLDFGMTRRDCVAAVGGGVVGDLAGFAAASYMRGIDFYNFPTTVLSMVDSSIGGKTAVNLAGLKNIVGAFHQPRAVVIDPRVLDTLPRRQVSNGLAEALKMGLSSDAVLFARFEAPGPLPMAAVIAEALAVKRAVVEQDEKEQGLRKVLNLGHTLGHGIEAAAQGRLLHGECVALGLLPMCAPAVRARLVPVLERLGLPTSVNFSQIDPDRVMEAIAHDKKAGADGSIETVYVPEPGCFEFRRRSLAELKALLMTLEKEH